MSGCGCLDIVDGAPVEGGGGGPPPPVVPGWTCVYEVDWRDAFAALGAVDLNFVGATLTYQGVTWQTPTVANSGINQNVSSTSWGLTANGLEVVGHGGGSIVANAPQFPHIFANLSPLSLNTATPFEGDPTRKYLLQAYVSTTNASSNFQESGVGLYKANGIPAGGYSTTFCTYGFNSGLANVPSGVAGNTAGPTRITRTDLATATPADQQRCPTIMYGGSGKVIDCYAAPFPSAFPANTAFQVIGDYAENTEFDNDTPGDPLVGWRATLGHGGAGLSAVIERFRICQL